MVPDGQEPPEERERLVAEGRRLVLPASGATLTDEVVRRLVDEDRHRHDHLMDGSAGG